ncbi:M14 family metallopeptidase [Solilutibacter tolerans]|uniref:Zinc carboxypeptidase n=1 Tax=Solilutibacter tolerans TaxID=1604334 RepID=A0A1N6XGD7_9GAMM|nr:M14 family metallopeptidase [Lysobacter tolerans]SIR01395.1 Zinc carboxypeptidase [Lysobacter tolerans]
MSRFARSAPLALALGIALAAVQQATAASPTKPPLTTLAERSGFLKTGRFDEVIALCDAFAKAYPQSVRCFDFGKTPEGRPMKALAVSTAGALTAEAARAQDLPVMLVQGGIHSGEIDGKDAVFWLLRELLSGKVAPGVLDKQVMVFVPVFNVDGHENFRAWNRPNQRGPEEMGFRTTAQRYNLNRDYLKADSTEMQAMLRLVNEWDPLVTMDLHVTDGAKFQHDISITAEPVNAGDAELQKIGRALRDGIIDKLATQGSKPVAFYPSFVEDDDPASGFAEGVAPPRFSHGYFMLRNRIGILVETHSWRTYPERVRATRNTVLDLLELAAVHGQQWQVAAAQADARASQLAGQSVPLAWKVLDDARTIDFQGYAYTRTPSTISGALMTRYDEAKPAVWKVPLRDKVEPALEANAPRAGYLVPVAWAPYVEPKLKTHGIEYRVLGDAMSQLAAKSFRATQAKFAGGSVEGHQRVTLEGSWQPETRNLLAGALFVPIAQPKARVVMNLLEPQAPDAIAAWGDMNNAFEQKEYMEGYVAEEQAEQMLAKDPALKAEFEKRLRDDADFAKSPEARLDFFYQRHAAYDRDYLRYPVLRVDAAPQ